MSLIRFEISMKKIKMQNNTICAQIFTYLFYLNISVYFYSNLFFNCTKLYKFV